MLQLAGHLGFMQKSLTFLLGHVVSVSKAFDRNFAIQLAIDRFFDDAPSASPYLAETLVA
ncbi:hypothetical protein GCM10023156_18730 [Novipirellula rosea]|uniref:Uncharacterized protein n=1 Tax=Novipirellula rosea TaxID=1031540 RepID=A0ABP8MJ49_9BACT